MDGVFSFVKELPDADIKIFDLVYLIDQLMKFQSTLF